MNITQFFPKALIVAIAGLSLGILPAAHAGNPPKKSTETAKTNDLPEELPVPLAVFDLTVHPTKDPFFPLSTRQPYPQPVNNTPPPINASLFVLKGVDGASDHRLALVNNRTLAKGEDAEVTTAAGKVKIHCLDIRANSVVLSIASQSEPLEIWLRKSVR